MKRFVVISIALSIVLLLTAALPAGSGYNPFRGNWKGIDVDGSNLSLSFDVEKRSGGRVFEIHGYDNICTGFCDGAPAKWECVGILEEENTINASCVVWKVPTGDPAFFFNGFYTYDPNADTVTDPDGIVYTRK